MKEKEKKKEYDGISEENRVHKKFPYIDRAEALSIAGVPNITHLHMVTPRAFLTEGKY